MPEAATGDPEIRLTTFLIDGSILRLRRMQLVLGRMVVATIPEEDR
jgi:hypothetical protein